MFLSAQMERLMWQVAGDSGNSCGIKHAGFKWFFVNENHKGTDERDGDSWDQDISQWTKTLKVSYLTDKMGIFVLNSFFLKKNVDQTQ